MKLGIIIGSVRQGRVSDKIARWIQTAAAELPGVNAELIDLLDYPLPLFDEPISPQFNQNRTPEGVTKRWLAALADKDAYVLVTPEYNRSIPGALKNAFDFVAYEMKGKPVAIATHGSSNGAQAVAHLRGIIPGLHAITTPAFVGLPFAVASSFADDSTMPTDAHGHYAAALETMLKELTAYSTALSQTD